MVGWQPSYDANIKQNNGTTVKYSQMQAAQPTVPQYDPMAELEKLKAAQKANAIAGLDRSKNMALSNLSAEKATIKPYYTAQRTQRANDSQLQAKNFAEYMQNRGTSVGANNQAELSRGLGLQGAMTNLGVQETNKLSDIDRRTTDVNNNYQADLASANAGIDAQGLQNYISQMNTDRALAAQQEQARQEQAISDKRYQDSMTQQQFENQFKEKQYEASLSQQELDNIYRNQKASSGNSASNVQENATKAAYNELYNQLDKGKDIGYNWIVQNRENIIRDLGIKVYDDMMSKYGKYTGMSSAGNMWANNSGLIGGMVNNLRK